MEDVPAWTILTLMTFVLISMIVVFGRAASGDNAVQAAAYAAARDASLSRGSDAVPHAIDAANRALGGNVKCAALNVTLGGNGLSTGLGQTGTVTATVSCTVSYTDLVFPGVSGLPGSFTISKTATSPVDPYRER
ncbi:hypothetical protein [Microbacterium testaceum]|uniref:hypothetical protein n=1 Tax=Microbacterium testaceum TaxID=2033 RepID=UPI002AC5FAF9|nr:hypothetical protein [Microbacterium testaceum]MDZ5146340.1 hypothetical protein [Microbacterium testaceum]